MPIKGREKLTAEMRNNADKFCRALAFETQGRLMNMTPVRSGRARANWNVAIGSPDVSNDDGRTIADVPTAQAEGMRVIGRFEAGQVLYLTNSLPYIPRLEDGWSKQAPAGMVKITAAQMQQFAAKAAQSVRLTAGEFTVG